MARDNPAHICQSNARPFKFFCGMEALEYSKELLCIFHIKPNAVVLSPKYINSFVPVLAPISNQGFCSCPCEFSSIAQKDDPHEPKHCIVAGDGG